MSKVRKIKHKEERKDNLNEPLVVIEQDSSLTKKRVITYPFNKEKRESVFEEEAVKSNKVGPGEYNVSKNKKFSQNVVSKNDRLPNYDNRNPGVGEYDIKEPNLKIETTAPKYGIPKAERKNPFEVSKEKKNVPGTGAYNVNVVNKKKFYIDEKVDRFHTIDYNRPGVGDYDINDAEIKLKKKDPTISAVKSVRKDPFEVSKDTRGVPGTGSYNINKKEKKGVYIEGKKQRFETSYNGRPGVGEYNINDAEINLKKKVGISTNKSVRKDPFEVGKESKNVPGAGSYNTISNQSRKFYIDNTVPRFTSSNNGKPGVGEYDINDAEIKLKKKTGISTNKSVRKDPFEVGKESKNVPGTGAYNINKVDKKGVYIEGNLKRFDTSYNGKPGVGEYNINDAELKLKKKTGISTSKSVRKDPFEVGKESKNVPGIGSYNISKTEKKGIYIGKKKRFETSYNGRPGVGEYDINDAEINLKKKTGISTSKSVRKDPFEVGKESKNVPGTGAYNINVVSKKGVYIEGNLRRFNTSNNGRPGVGEYDINDAELKLKKKTGISTSKSVRKDPFEVGKESKNVPGAGAYNTISNQSRKFYIDNNVPRFASSNNGKPGVGEYDINDAELKLKKKTGISTSKSVRKDPFEVGKESKNVPGAGAYNTIEHSKNKMYIDGIVPRFTSSDNGRPGVGEYDINDAALKLKKKTGISTSKSVRKDPFEVGKESKNVPGAGAYDTKDNKKKQFYIEGKVPRFNTPDNGRPGVGEYDINDAEIKLKKRSPKAFSTRSKRNDPFEVGKEQKGKPGAGSYNINRVDKRGVYIEGNVPRFASSENGKPGVGEYDINEAELNLKKKTGISTSKSVRKDPFEVGKESKNVPGTGAYNINKEDKKGVYIEGNVPRFGPSGNKNPGVGEYDINDAELNLKKKTGISKVKSARKDPFEVSKETKNVPGTGAYNINKEDKKGVYIEGNVPRFGPSGNKNPGVGEYDINDAELNLKKKTGISKVKSARKDPFEVSKETKNVPGTGAYNINKEDKKGVYIEGNVPRFGPSGNKNPGVGEYDINDAELNLKKKTGISTSKSVRKDPFEVGKESKNVPGTGAYNINKEEKKGVYIEGNVPRFGNSDNGKPGVGEYDINEAELNLKKKMAYNSNVKSERKDPFEASKESKIVPGAGAYNISKNEKKGVYIEGNVPRFASSNDGKPGVGEYDINDAELNLKKKTGISTVKSARKDPFEVSKETKNVPGTGAYNINKEDKKGVYIEGNVPRFGPSGNKNPGVGEYDINDAELNLKKKTGISNVKSARKDPFEVSKETKNVPGTGAYNINKEEKKGVYIEGNVPRFGPSGNKNPGVGEYDINDAELNLKKKTGISTVKSERKDPFEVSKETKNVPGTGAYNINKEDKKGVYIEGNVPRFASSNDGKPGVGEYDINDAELNLKKKTGISTVKSARKDPFEVSKETKNVPGTGAYNINKEDKKGVYIEGNVPRFGPSGNKNPGVGEYDINDAELNLKKKTGISTVKSERKDPFEVSKETKNVPGTGAYNINKVEQKGVYIEGNVPRFGSSNDGKPGVGEYDINDAELNLKKKTGISTVKSERKDPFEVSKETKNVPGTGAYNVNKVEIKGVYIEGNVPRFGNSDNGKPGVGEYDINDAEINLKKKTGISTAKSVRKDPFEVSKETKNVPGTGAYNISKEDKKGVYIEGNVPRFGSSNDGKPGVGEYDINDAELNLKKKTGISTVKSERKDPFEVSKETKNVPGTGAYNISKAEKNKFYMDKDVPRFVSSDNGKPGVGEYNINEAELNLKKKMAYNSNVKSERKDPFEASKESKIVPGAGAYNISKNEQKGVYIEGKIERFDNFNNGKPGVGEYDINDAELKLKKKTGISTAKSGRKDPFEVSKESKNVPGTGAYNIDKKEQQKFYIEGNVPRFASSNDGKPGVGEYDINDAELNLKKKIGISTVKSQRKDPFEVSKETKNVPGTGAYNIEKKEQQKFYIEPNMERFASSNDGKPGVGEYNVNDAELKLKKKTGISTVKSERKDPFEVSKESKNVPGTGAYNINKGEQQKFYIESNMERFTSSNNGKPGVGEYNINDAELKLKQKTGISVNKSERKDPFEVGKESKNVPGTGAYNVIKTEQHKFYIEEKIERFGNSSNGKPGVGEYDINDAEIKLKKKTGISTVKSVRKDPFEVGKESKNVPGTGAYNVIKSEEHKFYIEPNMERFGPSGNLVPGVGEYDHSPIEIKLKPKAPEYIEPQAERKPLFDTEVNEKVGPGSYEVKSEASKPGQQKFSTLPRKL